MFVQFSKSAAKVEKLPLISHGKRLFDKLNLQHVENEFFRLGEIDNLSAGELLKKARVFKLFVVINFGLSRRLNRIHECAAIYVTTWGEFFFKMFSDEKGLLFVEDAIETVKTRLDHPFIDGSVGYFIPQSAGKRMRLKA